MYVVDPKTADLLTYLPLWYIPGTMVCVVHDNILYTRIWVHTLVQRYSSTVVQLQPTGNMCYCRCRFYESHSATVNDTLSDFVLLSYISGIMYTDMPGSEVLDTPCLSNVRIFAFVERRAPQKIENHKLLMRDCWSKQKLPVHNFGCILSWGVSWWCSVGAIPNLQLIFRSSSGNVEVSVMIREMENTRQAGTPLQGTNYLKL